MRLEAESSKITAIITPWSVYRFLACTFGILTAPGEYQARMAHHILQDYYLNGAVVYIDDTIIYGKNEESFLALLDQILSKLVEFNVRLKPSKCYFGMDHIESWATFLAKKGCMRGSRGSGESRSPLP